MVRMLFFVMLFSTRLFRNKLPNGGKIIFASLSAHIIDVLNLLGVEARSADREGVRRADYEAMTCHLLLGDVGKLTIIHYVAAAHSFDYSRIFSHCGFEYRHELC